jgi:SPP1 gp7 family putative phage head morphogenesis protein
MKQLENASARFHISKLESLKLKTQMTAEMLYGKMGPRLTSAFEQIYKDNYYHAAFELQQGVNVGWDIAAVNAKQVESVLSKPWTLDKQTFSDRIWKQKQSLINELHTQLTQAAILGKKPDEAVRAIATKFNTSKSNAARLVYTESGYFAVKAQHDAFEELDVEEFEVVETLDSLTCPLCRSFDGKHLPMSQFEAGVNAPLFHPSCRGCICPYFEDLGGERFARDAEGNAYYVPNDMKYEDWKQKFVDGGDKTGLKRVGNDGKIDTSGVLDEGALMEVDMNPAGRVPTATKTETIGGDTIKRLDVEGFEIAASDSGISDDVSSVISRTIRDAEAQGGFYISETEISPIPNEGSRTVMMQIEPIAAGPQVRLLLRLNEDAFKGRSLEEIDALFAHSKGTVADSLKEAVWHEIGHAKLITRKSAEDIQALYEDLKPLGLPEISLTAADDGAEAIAEIEVLLRRGDSVPETARKFYDKYMKRG